MKVIIYDRTPGPGLMNFFLAISWRVGAWFQKVFGPIHLVIAASSPKEINKLLIEGLGGRRATEIQYWGHGSVGRTWISGQEMNEVTWWQALGSKVVPGSTVWFRTCSTFQGEHGKVFAQGVADYLMVRAAGHTRTVGIIQGGLHTCTPGFPPAWDSNEGELSGWLATLGLKWGPKSVFFWSTSVPDGW